MIDYTSSLYLNFRHPSRSLRPWSEFSKGMPAALAPPLGSLAVAHKLAQLIGCEHALLAPSTLHLFWDLFGKLPRKNFVIYADEGIYPIARWGVERAIGRGIPVQFFPHKDTNALLRMLTAGSYNSRPLILSDSFFPSFGKPAPIEDYLQYARLFDGIVVLDDTQALGILGAHPSLGFPYGKGGGGMLRWSRSTSSRIIVISSLAKGFGVPIAVFAGGMDLVSDFESISETQVHTSPPSVASIYATEHALSINTKYGDAFRLRLAQLVMYFRNTMSEAGFTLYGGLFPVQTLRPIVGLSAEELYSRLLQQNIKTILHKGTAGTIAYVSFILTTRHSPNDIVKTIRIIKQLII